MLLRLGPEGREIGGDHDAGDNLHTRLLEGVDLRCEIIRKVLIPPCVCERISLVGQNWREADNRVAPCVPITVIREKRTNRFVGIKLTPHVGEDGYYIFKSPEEMICEIERLPTARVAGIALLPNEPRLPRSNRRNAGDFFVFAGRRNGVRRLWCGRDKHQVNLIIDDEFLSHFSGSVGIRLAILDDHLEIRTGVRRGKAVENKLVGFGKGGERPRLRRDVSNAYTCALSNRRRRQPMCGECHARGGGRFQKVAACQHLVVLP